MQNPLKMKSSALLVLVLAHVGKQVEHMGNAGGFEMLLPASEAVAAAMYSPGCESTLQGLFQVSGSGELPALYLPTQPDSKPPESN